MKYLLIVLFLLGCGSSGGEKEPLTKETTSEIEVQDVYIVAGQSNAYMCDWSYFEELTNSAVVNIAIPGASIEKLINETDYSKLNGVDAKAVLLVHGETDAYIHTDSDVYIEKLKAYHSFISSAPLYISTVGFDANGKHEDSFNSIRGAVNVEAENNENWFISFNDAQYFRGWGMLSDPLHFTEDGCLMMMDAFAEQVFTGQ